MDEKTISERTRDILKKRGFFCLKFSDTSRSGIPDMEISKNGKTVHVEDKYISLQAGLGQIRYTTPNIIILRAKQFISKDRAVQLVTMCKLERTAYRAEYWLYIECDSKYYIAVLEPHIVFESYKNDTEIKMIPMDVNEFRMKFEV